mgnify:CR=1 FL=1
MDRAIGAQSSAGFVNFSAVRLCHLLTLALATCVLELLTSALECRLSGRAEGLPAHYQRARDMCCLVSQGDVDVLAYLAWKILADVALSGSRYPRKLLIIASAFA